MLNFKHVAEAASEVRQTAQWSTIALVSITLVSVAALLIATTALVAVKR